MFDILRRIEIKFRGRQTILNLYKEQEVAAIRIEEEKEIIATEKIKKKFESRVTTHTEKIKILKFADGTLF